MKSQTHRPLRFGLVGCGSIGPTHAAAIKQIPELAELVAVADFLPDRAKKVAQRFAGHHIYPDCDALLNDPEIDAVILATPSGLHAEGAIRAMRAGKHVIVEKPMEVSLEACDRMIAAEQETGKKLAIISQHRWDEASVFVRDAIQSGALGKLMLIDAQVKWWRTQKYYDSGDWRGTWKLDGGGALMNQGVHTVDLVQWLAGPVKDVFARTATAGHERIEVEDIALATLSFESGALGTITASTACFEGEPVRISIYGTQGTAIIEGDRLKLYHLKSGLKIENDEANQHAVSVARGGTASVQDDASQRLESGAASNPGAIWGDSHREQIRDFVHAVRENRRPLIDGCEGRKPVEIIRAVYESAKRGEVTELGKCPQKS